MNDPTDRLADLLAAAPRVVNVGLAQFADDLEGQRVQVVRVEWSPPAGGDPELADLLSRLGM